MAEPFIVRVEKRGRPGKWIVDYYYKPGKHTWKTFNTEEQAKAFRLQVLTAMSHLQGDAGPSETSPREDSHSPSDSWSHQSLPCRKAQCRAGAKHGAHHLRHLRALLYAALDDELIFSNPAAKLGRQLRPVAPLW